MNRDKEKFYYNDEEHDLIEYKEGKEDHYAHWVNPYLTLLLKRFHTPSLSDIIGFQILGIKHFFKKAEEQKNIPLTKEEEDLLESIFSDKKKDKK